ncbi:MAG: prolipoprotein diacylglyceryl transferase [Clostridia bacterium]
MQIMLSRVAFSIFGIEIYWYGITASTGVMLGVLVAYNLAKKYKSFDPDEIINIILWTVPFGIVGARLYYVIFQWQNYSQNLLEIVAIRDGGLAFHGGIILGVLVGLIYCRLRKLPLWDVFDCFGPALLIGQGFGRWGNFFNQEAHGGPVSEAFISKFPAIIKNQMLIDGTYYQPTFLYEFLWNMLVLAIILIFWRRLTTKPGRVFGIYLISYSIGRFFIEGLRTDSLMLGSFRVAQIVSVGLIILGTLLILWRNRQHEAIGVLNIENANSQDNEKVKHEEE